MKYQLLVMITIFFALTNSAWGQDDVVSVVPAPLAVQEIAPPGVIDWHAATHTLALMVHTDATFAQGSPRDGRSIEIWNPIESSTESQANSRLAQTPVNSGSVFAYSPDGLWLAILSPDMLSIVDAASGRILVEQTGAPTYFLAWSPDSTRLAIPSTADYYALDLVDALTGNLIETYRFFNEDEVFPGAALRNVTWSNNIQLAVIGAGDRRASLNFQTSSVTDIHDCCPEGAYQLEWQPDGRSLATHDRVYNIDTRQPLFYFSQQNKVFWSPNGQWLLGITLNQAALISMAEQRIVLQFSVEQLGEGHAITNAAWSPDGDYVALVTNTIVTLSDNTPTYQSFVSVWDMITIGAEVGFTLQH